MTFGEYKAAVIAAVTPEPESVRLSVRHENWIIDSLIDLQKRVVCLQTAHFEEILQPATLFSCGATAFSAPDGGYIRSLRVEQIDNVCNYVDAIPYTEAEFRGVLAGENNCGCLSSTEVPYGYYYSDYYGSYYPLYEGYPFGLVQATTDQDLAYRPGSRVFSLYDGYVWLWPRLNSTDKAILKWHGVRKSWGDDVEMPWKDESGNDDREIQRAVELWLGSQVALWDDCDANDSAVKMAMYQQERAKMIADCKKKNRLPDLVSIVPAC